MVDLLSTRERLGNVNASTRPGPRERLLSAARRLTYSEGVGVGVDAILREADVARRSLYQHFGGKDGLIVATLHESADTDVARYRRALDTGGTDPRERVLALFDVLDGLVSVPGYRGCRYAAAGLAVTDPDHPVHTENRIYKRRLHALFEAELVTLGHPDPARGGAQILLLVDGVLATAVRDPESHPARAARALAEYVLNERAPG
jgi:AcrR family transcriptional regulator